MSLCCENSTGHWTTDSFSGSCSARSFSEIIMIITGIVMAMSFLFSVTVLGGLRLCLLVFISILAFLVLIIEIIFLPLRVRKR